MDYLIEEGPGRDDFVRFWRLMAEAVREHPSAFAAEWMNEPMTIRRKQARCKGETFSNLIQAGKSGLHKCALPLN